MASSLDRTTLAGSDPGPASAPPLSRFDRITVIACIGGLVAAGWTYLAYQDWAMRHMDDMAMPGFGAWSPSDLTLVFIMWAVMMVAMMLPSAMPMLLIHRRLAGAAAARPGAQTALFALGYLLVWTAFGAVATIAQWALHSALLISPAIRTNAGLSGALLIAAGVYQWTPLKQTCLAGCASPLQFLSRHWRAGKIGAVRMGLLHGAYCLGCCWLLMALLFVYGVMNIAWIGAITLYILVEKLMPRTTWLPRAAGALLIGWGVALTLFPS